MEMTIYNQQGEVVEKIELPSPIFDAPWNADLVHQALRVSLANRRNVIAHAKGRSEVRGGGRKPWQQKGTGRARHGSRRSPIWRGGGVTYGPRKERDFSLKLSKKMRRAAIAAVLSKKARDGEIVILDKIAVEGGKTKRAGEILFHLIRKDKGSASCLLLLPARDTQTQRAFRNLARTKTMLANGVNVLDLLNHKFAIIPKESIGILEKTLTRT